MGSAGDREDSLSLKVLADIRTVWPEGQEGPERCCFTKTLLERLKSLEESPWDKYGLSPHKVARMLRPFEVESRDVRIGAEVLKGYEYRSLQAAFSRYLEV